MVAKFANTFLLVTYIEKSQQLTETVMGFVIRGVNEPFDFSSVGPKTEH